MSQLITWRPLGADLVLLIVRVLFGIACIVHGWGKVTAMDKFIGKWRLSPNMSWLVTITQVLGGALLIVGLAHGWASLALAICGAGITWKLIFDAKEPFMAPGQHSWDMGMMYTLLPLLLLVTGPGRYAIDALLR